MGSTHIERRKRHGESLPFVETGSAINEGCGEERRLRAAPEISEGRVSNFVEAGCVLKCGVEHAEPRANTGIAQSAQYAAQDAVFRIGRVCQAQPGSKVVVAHRSQGSRNSRITGENPSFGRARK